MTLDQRSVAILTELHDHNAFLSAQELADHFNVSRRTIYYDIEKINDWLEANQLDVVEYVRSQGFRLSKKTKEQLPQHLDLNFSAYYEWSPEERTAWILILLLLQGQPLFLDDLAALTKVSRNTTLVDISRLRKELMRFSLTLKSHRGSGYDVQGEEDAKRKALLYFVDKLGLIQGANRLHAEQIQLEQGRASLFDEEKIQSLTFTILECEKELGLQYADEVIYQLAVRFWLFARRQAQNQFITMDVVEKEVLGKTKEMKAAARICQKVEELVSIPIPEDEVYFFTIHLLGAKVQHWWKPDLQSDEHKKLEQVVKKMTDDFQFYACVYIENRKEMEQQLLLHVKPAYYRVKYGLEMKNGMTNEIKEKYSDIFQITQKVIHHLETLVEKKVSDDEIAFIAIHFGGWLRMAGFEPTKRKKAWIVCANGVGTSAIIKSQLEHLFSSVDFTKTLSLRDYNSMAYGDVDFVVSTVTLEKSSVPVFKVNPILSDMDKERLLKQVHSMTGEESVFERKISVDSVLQVVKQFAQIENEQALKNALRQKLLDIPEKSVILEKNLLELLPIEHIQCVDAVHNWEEAIEVAASPLLQKGMITKEYVLAMIQHVKELGPYIKVSPDVALPHGKPEEGVRELSYSLLKLKHPVDFIEKSDSKVAIWIVLASIDQHSHLHSLNQLSNIFQKGVPAKLQESQSPQELKETLEAILLK